ncbi:MAG: insulinase family protein [Oscillospiraceae bacterium]|nr:insulinase family protein [Oscillospiraceae bacterium]
MKRVFDNYHRITHKSGCEVIVIPKDFANTYAVYASRYGAAHKTYSVDGGTPTVLPEGIHHFLEHKLFANPDGEDTSEKFGRAGAHCNAYTSHEVTAYEFSTTADPYSCLEILLKSTHTPHFTKSNVATELGIVREETQMYLDSPEDTLHYSLLKAMYSALPVRDYVIGTLDSIEKITAEMLSECHHAFYHPSDMFLIVCGPVEIDKVLAVADMAIPTQTSPNTKILFPAEPAKVFAPILRKTMDVSKPIFKIGVKNRRISADVEANQREHIILAIIAEALFSESGEFASSIFDEGLTPAPVWHYTIHNPLYSHLALGGDSDQPDEIYRRFRSIVKRPLCPRDTARARRVVYSNFIRSLQTTNGIVDTATDFFLRGGDIQGYPQQIASVTFDEIADFAGALFREEHCCMAVVAGE